jgi:glycosidase
MASRNKVRVTKLSAYVLLAAAPLAGRTRTKATASAQPWYVSAAAIHRVMLKPHGQYWRFEHLAMDPDNAKQQMLEWKNQGITALEVFAPEEGGNSYDGLDAKDRFRLDLGLGSIRDFEHLIAQAHQLGFRVITFQNLGYSSVDAPQFVKAEGDVHRGLDTRESRFFFWSKTSTAPPPATGNSYFLIRPKRPGYDPIKNEFWQWSDRAQSYYWTRWPGKDAHGATVHLPQYNWASPEWPAEAQKVVRFWMKTGLDGMILDAVNWYVGATWQKINDNITEPIASYGLKLSQPEGGGAFHSDDPVGWITEGSWNNLNDYGATIWWEKDSQILQKSVRNGNPQLFENALRAYHDRVVAGGGTLYLPVPNLQNPDEQQLAESLLATSGDLLCYCGPVGEITYPAAGVSALLKLKAVHPALYQNSSRRQIPTNNDEQFYATLRTGADHSERLLIVFNFQRQIANIQVDLGTIDGSAYIPLDDKQSPNVSANLLQVQLPAFGHRIFLVKR